MDETGRHHAKCNKLDRAEETNNVRDHLCMQSLFFFFNSPFHRNRVERWFPGTRGGGNWEDVDRRVAIFSFKMSKFSGSNVQPAEYS